MFPTYELIASQTLGSNAASVTFSGIPQTYDDLVIMASLRGSAGNAYHAVILQFNGVATSYSTRELTGNGASVSSASRGVLDSGMLAGDTAGSTATANTFGSLEIYIPNYAGSANKSVSITQASETNGTTAYLNAIAGLWSNTSAISSIKLSPYSAQGTNFLTGSSVYLFGIREETA